MTHSVEKAASNRIDEIEVLRGIAALMVVVAHLYMLFPWNSPLLMDLTFNWLGPWIGVDLFFCISGFVIARSVTFPGSHGEIDFLSTAVPFWIRRAWRLLPSAWLWLLMFVGAAAFFNHSGAFGSLKLNLFDAIAAVLNVANFHNYICQSHPVCGVIAVYWSLSLEEQFYFIFPFLVFFVPMRFLVPAFLVVAIVFFFRNHYHVSLMNFTRLDALLFGILLGLAQKQKLYVSWGLRIFLHRGLAYSALGAGLVLAMWFAALRVIPFSSGLASLACAGLVFLASFDRGYLVPASRARDIFVAIGKRSYALYLIHTFAFLATREIWFRVSTKNTAFNAAYTIPFLVTAIIIICVATELNYRFVEIPLRVHGRLVAESWKSKRLRRRLALEYAC